MRNKIKPQKLSVIILSFLALAPAPAVQGDWHQGLWSVHHLIFLPLLREKCPSLLQWGVSPAGDSFPLTSPQWVYFMSSSSMQTAAMWVHPMVIGPPQTAPAWGTLPWSAVLQGQALQHGLLSPGASYKLTAFSQASMWSNMGLFHRLQVDVYISMDLHGLMGCRVTAASLWPAPQAAGESPLQCLMHLLPLLLHWP